MIQTEHLVEKIADDQVRTARAIVVGGVGSHVRASRSLFAQRDAGSQCLVDKPAVTIVAIKPCRDAVTPDEDVRPSVEVIVEHDDPHCLRRLVQPCRSGGVLEPAAAKIPIEPGRDGSVGIRTAVASHSLLRAGDFIVR